MKEVWLFLKWKWAKFTFADKCWFGGAFLVGSGTYEMWTHPQDPIPLRVLVGFGLWFTVLTKWFIVDQIKDQWLKYKKEKSELFNTIKESEHASKS